jgi:hypothetical protein
MINGSLTNKAAIEGVHVFNTTSGYNVITDQNGTFKIEVKILDTLHFSAINFYPQKVVVTQENYTNKELAVTLRFLTNELDEVFIGNQLSGTIAKDVRCIKTGKNLSFDDVRIPGFKGTPKEEMPIVIGQTGTPFSINVDALYKHILGYYENLKTMRQWQGQSNAVAKVFNLYPLLFFEEAYGILQNKAYCFVMMCLETTQMSEDIAIKKYNGILTAFKNTAPIYLANLAEE